MIRQVFPYAQARERIQDGDVLLFRGQGLIAWGVSVITKSPYNHAAEAAWWSRILMCVETRGLRNARAVVLSSQVKKYRCRIDVYRYVPVAAQGLLRGSPIPARAAAWAIRNTATPYGWWAIVRALVQRLPGSRLIWRASTDDARRGPIHCSANVAASYRHSGDDLCPGLSDTDTTPTDLAASRKLKYICTIGVL